jgi:undecaprenyl-diphosphatase
VTGETVQWWHALLLGVVQGVTEFLPISSSGHLAVAESLFGIHSGGLALVMLVHAGTLLSVALVFRDEVFRLVRGTLGLPRVLARPYRDWPVPERHAALAILATIPGVLAGYFLEEPIERSFSDLAPIGWQFVATGALLLATRRARVGTKEVSPGAAVLIGIAQAIAILPAISRSGTTIATALFLGVRRDTAGEFSFVISVPIIFGAVLLKVPELTGGEFHGQGLPLALAFLSSFVVGWVSLLWLVRVIRHGRFHWFAPYCFLAGLATLLLAHRTL